MLQFEPLGENSFLQRAFGAATMCQNWNSPQWWDIALKIILERFHLEIPGGLMDF